MRAGNAARNRVDGLRFAGVALAGARIEQLHRVAAEMRQHVVGVDDIFRVESNRERALPRIGKLARYRIAECRPGGKAAVEHGDVVVADPAREKPKPRGKHIAAGVVRDELRVVAGAAAPQKAREALRIRERMTAVLAGLRSGELVFDRRKEGAGKMRLFVEPQPKTEIAQRVPAVDDDETLDRRAARGVARAR